MRFSRSFARLMLGILPLASATLDEIPTVDDEQQIAADISNAKAFFLDRNDKNKEQEHSSFFNPPPAATTSAFPSDLQQPPPLSPPITPKLRVQQQHQDDDDDDNQEISLQFETSDTTRVPESNNTQQPPYSRFTMQELQRLLITLEEHVVDGEDDRSEEQTTNRVTQAATDDEDIIDDDRTLLDVFGQVAHSYLCQRVIPPTDAQCVWDWRSLQCEPACACDFQPMLGDYQVGRSCRLRERQDDDDDGSTSSRTCGHPFTDPTVAPALPPRPRLVWQLLRRTAKGIRNRSQRAAQGVLLRSAVELSHLQTYVCAELWTLLYYEKPNSCWPRRQVPVPTLAERLLCGPMHFPICPVQQQVDNDSNFMNASRL
jgi:hypothetical protein